MICERRVYIANKRYQWSDANTQEGEGENKGSLYTT